MAIVTKKLIDHIYFQFGYGGEHQVALGIKPGEFSGGHFAEVEYLFDDETGQIVGETKNEENRKPKPIEASKVQEFLGTAMIGTETQFRDFAVRLTAAQKQRDELTTANSQLTDQLTATHEQLAAFGAAFEQARRAYDSQGAELAAARQESAATAADLATIRADNSALAAALDKARADTAVAASELGAAREEVTRLHAENMPVPRKPFVPIRIRDFSA